MRGQAVSRRLRKVDTVVVSVRYSPGRGELSCVRAYDRRGSVWSDWLILDRQALLARLEAGKRVLTGATVELAGDFRLANPVRRVGRDGQRWIVAGVSETGRDDLDVPLF